MEKFEAATSYKMKNSPVGHEDLKQIFWYEHLEAAFLMSLVTGQVQEFSLLRILTA